MRFIRKNGQIIPIGDKAASKYGKQAGRLLGRVGPLQKKAKQLHALADQQLVSPNALMRGKTHLTRMSAEHFAARAGAAKALGMKAGKVAVRAARLKKGLYGAGAAALIGGAMAAKNSLKQKA